MKKTISFIPLLLALFLIISCSKDKDLISGFPSEKKTLEDFFNENGVQSQKFIINSGRDTSLYTYGYSQLMIPKNSFVTLNGQLVSSAVSIEIVEILNKKNMILSGIFPVSNGKPLISGGEYFIKATRDGSELKLAFNSNVTLKAPVFSIPSSNMQIFYASDLDENTNWGIPALDSVMVNPNLTWPSNTYDMQITNLRWINCDYFYDKPGAKTTVKVSVGSEYNDNNTHVFVTLDSLNSACMFNSYANLYFFTGVNYELPVGQKVTFVALSKINGQYYSAFQPATIADKHIENLILSPTTLDDFKLALEILP